MRSKDQVTIAWIDPGQVDGLFAVSMLGLYGARTSRISTVIRIGGSLLSRQRNQVITAFLDDNTAEWLFMIDSDETITPEAFDKLCAAAHETERPIVAGIYFGAWESAGPYPRPMPMILRLNERGTYDAIDDFPADRTIPVDAAGTGALLVHRSVLEAMRDDSNAGPMAAHEAGKWCWFRDLAAGGEWVGEDVYFCRNAKRLGFPIVAATGARLGHHKSYWLTDQHHAAYLAQQEQT